MGARLEWNRPQSMALQARHRYVDLEGGIRAGKTTPLVAKAATLAVDYPGIHCLLARWTDDAVGAQLRPAWRDMAERVGLEVRWHADEQYDEVVVTGSRVYVRGLRASEDTNRYGKFRGLTLAWIGIDQAEEVPYDIWLEVAGRLSQPGYPHQIWVTPQPVMPDHWIAKTFPDDNGLPDHFYIRTNVYDNVAHVGQAYVDSLEALYPLGSSQRRTLLEGLRGLTGKGDPVYAGYFNRRTHVCQVEMDAALPLLEAWDWGHGHPCVSWSQFWPVGAYVQLGAVMGESMFLEDFVPAALFYRERWCPRPLTVWATGDPAGLDVTNQGTRISKVREVLASHGVRPNAMGAMNLPEMRYDAIQATGAYMRRMALDGGAGFRVNPRAVVLRGTGAEERATFTVDGYEAGYVWSDLVVRGRQTVRVPKKDGYYDHFQNCLVGSTLVETVEGPVAIRDLVGRSGHLISTDGAVARFTNARLTRRHAEVVRVQFSNGSETICTPDHRFWTTQGWVRAAALVGASCYNAITQRIIVQSWRERIRPRTFKSLRALGITCAASITNVLASVCIGASGSGPMGRFLPAWTSITSTGTGRITPWRISAFSPDRTIFGFMGNRGSLDRCLDTSSRPADRGTAPRRDDVGIANTSNETAPNLCISGSPSSARGAAFHSQGSPTKAHSSSTTGRAARRIAADLGWTMKNACAWAAARLSWLAATRNSANARAAAVVSCVAVSPAGREDVYCLTVPGLHAFAVNGSVLVANCNEYTILMHGPGLMTQETLKRHELRELRKQQRDRDPADGRGGRIDPWRHPVGR